MATSAEAREEEDQAKGGRVTPQGVTFDSAVLVALERRKQHAWDVFRRLQERAVPVSVPAPVLGEWWRGRTDVRDAIRQAVIIEPLSEMIACLAGEALAHVKRATTIDAFVMASAALRGDVVFTGDVDDLEKLRAFFPGVRVLSI